VVGLVFELDLVVFIGWQFLFVDLLAVNLSEAGWNESSCNRGAVIAAKALIQGGDLFLEI
jgi:hypothetical protein